MDLVQRFAFAPTSGAPPEDKSFVFDVDFDSDLVWPDAQCHDGSITAHYSPSERSPIIGLLREASYALSRINGPAHAFVDRHLKRVVVRRVSPFRLAGSSSNRVHMGTCL